MAVLLEWVPSQLLGHVCDGCEGTLVAGLVSTTFSVKVRDNCAEATAPDKTFKRHSRWGNYFKCA